MHKWWENELPAAAIFSTPRGWCALFVAYGPLVYADDLCLIAKTKEEIANLLEMVSVFSTWSGMAKYGCLSMINSSSRGRYMESFSPAYSDKYLGVEIGRSRKGTVDPLMKDVEATVDKILQSQLTDWQKVDAINTFAMSKLTYHLNSSCLNRSWATKLDGLIRRKLKKAIHLPVRTISSFFHLPSHMGGLGLQSVEDSLEAAIVIRVLKCLMSKDLLVLGLACDQLRATILNRTGESPEDVQQVLTFLHTPPPPGEYAKGDVRSLWSMVRKALKFLDVTIETGAEDTYHLIFGSYSAKAGKWEEVAAVLKRAREQRRLKLVLESKDQGRSFHLISKDQSSNHWIAGGRYTSFAAYRFAIKARLNLLPVKTVVRRTGKNISTTCPRCKSQPESLGHVLNACQPNTGLMRARHNVILERLVKAIPKEGRDVYVEQSISSDNLRPDIVVHDRSSGEAVVVDVSCPYESAPDAFSKSRSKKEQKYAGLKTWMLAQPQYKKVSVHAFIVGALGSWDEENTEGLRALGVRRNYTPLFSKLCCVDAIKGSLDIWKARSHC